MSVWTAVMIMAALLLAETAGTTALIQRELGLAAILGIHLVVCGAALGLSWRRERPELLIGAAATLTAGPAGAIAGLLLCLLSTKRRRGGLSEWHKFLALGTQATDAEHVFMRLANGQALDAGRALPKRFENIFDGGSLRDQQALLGVMAQSYHPSFRSLLQKALRSPAAPIRVQAASVYTALRTREVLRLAEAASARDTDAATAALQYVAQLTNSQFLDENERKSAKSLLRGMIDGCTSTIETTDPGSAARIRILAEAGLLAPAAELARAAVPHVQPRAPDMHPDV